MKNVFLVTSCLITNRGKIPTSERFLQTLETIRSVKNYAKDCYIFFCDNSQETLSPDYKSQIQDSVDYYLDYKHNLFSSILPKFFNTLNEPSALALSELLIYEQFLKFLNTQNICYNRIFKISARYQLTDRFNIDEYNKLEYKSKFVFKITPWKFWNEQTGNEYFKIFYETRLWSMDKELITMFEKLLPEVFLYSFINNENIEVSLHNILPKQYVLIKEKLGLTGTMAHGLEIED